MSAVLPHGRLFRAVLRRCQDRRRRARHRADQPGRKRRGGGADVRRAGAFRRRLSRPPDPRRAPGRDCRAGRDARRSPRTRQGRGQAFVQGAGREADHPLRDCGHADRGHAARTAPRESAGGIVRAARARGNRGVRHLDRADGAGGVRGRRGGRRAFPPRCARDCCAGGLARCALRGHRAPTRRLCERARAQAAGRAARGRHARRVRHVLARDARRGGRPARRSTKRAAPVWRSPRPRMASVRAAC